MSAFDTLDGIPGWDPRDDGIGLLNLVEIDTAEDTLRFGVGFDARFVDVNGMEWLGATILRVSSMPSALSGVAPEGDLSLSFFQDPDEPDFITSIMEDGPALVAGRPIRFYLQPLRTPEEMFAPTIAPVLVYTRIMRTLTAAASGAQGRTLKLTFEAWSEKRRQARRIRFDRAGHELLLGESNPSLEYRPTDMREDEKLF